MRVLVVYYSRTGTTEKVAHGIASLLGADTEQIIDNKNRRGAWGWFWAGRDATLKRLTSIKQIAKHPGGYDLVIIGTPIWLSVTPAVRTYLSQFKNSFNKVAFFCTMGGSGAVKAFTEMELLADKKPLATLALKADIVKNNTYQEMVKEFVQKIC